jgi:hypothetical protein
MNVTQHAIMLPKESMFSGATKSCVRPATGVGLLQGNMNFEDARRTETDPSKMWNWAMVLMSRLVSFMTFSSSLIFPESIAMAAAAAIVIDAPDKPLSIISAFVKIPSPNLVFDLFFAIIVFSFY